jgi:hypothetical protein
MRSKSMNDIIQMPKGDYIMKDAVRVDTGETRTDGWYPEWIGMTMQFRPIPIGWIAQFRYVKDNEGYPYPGGMHTSSVTSVSITEDEKIVKIETAHTIYTFEKVKED